MVSKPSGVETDVLAVQEGNARSKANMGKKHACCVLKRSEMPFVQDIYGRSEAATFTKGGRR